MRHLEPQQRLLLPYLSDHLSNTHLPSHKICSFINITTTLTHSHILLPMLMDDVTYKNCGSRNTHTQTHTHSLTYSHTQLSAFRRTAVLCQTILVQQCLCMSGLGAGHWRAWLIIENGLIFCQHLILANDKPLSALIWMDSPGLYTGQNSKEWHSFSMYANQVC